jgi:hypothetical protein
MGYPPSAQLNTSATNRVPSRYTPRAMEGSGRVPPTNSSERLADGPGRLDRKQRGGAREWAALACVVFTACSAGSGPETRDEALPRRDGPPAELVSATPRVVDAAPSGPQRRTHAKPPSATPGVVDAVTSESQQRMPKEPTPVQPPTTPTNPWPTQANASWPAQCLIEGVAIHPVEPWLAVACTNSQDESGAVLVFDAQAGKLLSATTFETYVGWSDSRDLLRWHPDGTRLATNISTNGIAVLDRGRLVGEAYPDETRDHGVGHVWIGDQIFADTGALFKIEEGDSRFDFDALTVPRIADMRWNAAVGAVVGRSSKGLLAFDPLRNKMLYEVNLEAHAMSRDRWSADGRWCALVPAQPFPEPDVVRIHSGDSGVLQWTVRASAPKIDDVRWAADGALLVSSYTDERGKRRGRPRFLDVIRQGRIAATVALADREIRASGSVPETGVPEASGIASSPTGDGFALLLDGQQIRIHDTRSGQQLSTFHAPAAPISARLPESYRGTPAPSERPGDLLWISPQRFVRLSRHFVAFWSLDGNKIAEFVVPDGD